MKRIYSYKKDKGILYLVATPIGNLRDITYRAVETLKSVDVIYAEDTRNSIVLLKEYDIKTNLLSYHEFNKELKRDEIVNKLLNGNNVAIISDAGLPVISDPGYDIARAAIENNVPVTPIPGASAGISALIASGLEPQPFTFIGFLDSKRSQRVKQLNDYKYIKNTMIFYEAPHRIKETIEDIIKVFGNRYIVVGRELTKKFEEFIRGQASEVLEVADSFKGEIVLLVSGDKTINTVVDPMKEIESLINMNYRMKDAVKEISLMFNLDKHNLYKEYINYKKSDK